MFGTTLEFTRGENNARNAPEYAHIRRSAAGKDLNLNPEMSMDPKVLLGTKASPNRALHYVDFTGDGWITVVELPELSGIDPVVLPAFSIISAPDFYPMVSQYEMERWSLSNPGVWAAGGPNVLSNHRIAVDLHLASDNQGQPVVFGEGNACLLYTSDAADE